MNQFGYISTEPYIQFEYAGQTNRRYSVPVGVAVGLCTAAGVLVPMKRVRHFCVSCIASWA
jgi:hypothetical protein